MRNTLAFSFTVLFAVLSSGGAAVAQAEVSPSPSPGASPAPPTADTGTLAFEQPQWKRITPQRGPAAREDHTWTVDSAGHYAYLFGGRGGGKDFGDLWRYDMENDSWKKLSPGGAAPSARFGHSAVWVDGHGLVVFAGQKGVEFFGDLWAFDPDAGKWKALPANGAAPKRRYGSCMIEGPDGRLWISHGFTFAGRFDDTRAYNLKSKRWASIAPDGRRPGERCLHDCFTSASGQLVLYGGQDNSVRALGDLWVTRPDGSWKKAANPKLAARRMYAVTEAGDYAYIFGGAGKDDRNFDDLWRVDRETLEFEQVRVDGAGPSARYGGAMVTDSLRGRVLLFGGQGGSAKDDVWQLTDFAATADGLAAADEAASAEPMVSPEPEG
jgi:hypothetical protein